MKNNFKKNIKMFTAIVLIQVLAVSIGSYVNFALEEPCPEKYYGTSKCYIYTYKSNDKGNFYYKKRVYIKKPWVSFEDVTKSNKLQNQKS